MDQKEGLHLFVADETLDHLLRDVVPDNSAQQLQTPASRTVTSCQ
jgi:hypothetical protein